MVPYGWTALNSVAAFFPESFEPSGQEQYLFAWIVENESEVQDWLVEDGGWNGTIYDADPVNAVEFIQRVERLFALSRKATVPDLSWVMRGWVAHEGDDEVSMVGEGVGRWLIVCYSLGSYTTAP